MSIESGLFNAYLKCERRLAGLSSKRLCLDEGEFAYLEGGQGPTLLLLHGFGADKDSWNKLAKRLTQRFHVVAIDIPGFGESYCPKGGYDIGSQARRVFNFISRKALQNFTIIGNSYGGYIAALLSEQHPDRIKSSILISPLGFEQAPLTEMFKDVVEGRSPLLLPRNLSEFSQLLNVCFYKMPFIPTFAKQQMLKRNLDNVTLHHNLFYQTHLCIDGHLRFDYALEHVLRGIEVPTHVIWGEQDAILSAEALQLLKRIGNDNITQKCMDSMGHLPQIENPTRLSEHIMTTALAS